MLQITTHKLANALLNREYLVQKQVPLGKEGAEIVTEQITTDVPQARSCIHADKCIWGHVVKAGGTPCDKCRYLQLGDYFIEE